MKDFLRLPSRASGRSAFGRPPFGRVPAQRGASAMELALALPTLIVIGLLAGHLYGQQVQADELERRADNIARSMASRRELTPAALRALVDANDPPLQGSPSRGLLISNVRADGELVWQLPQGAAACAASSDGERFLLDIPGRARQAAPEAVRDHSLIVVQACDSSLARPAWALLGLSPGRSEPMERRSFQRVRGGVVALDEALAGADQSQRELAMAAESEAIAQIRQAMDAGRTEELVQDARRDSVLLRRLLRQLGERPQDFTLAQQQELLMLYASDPNLLSSEWRQTLLPLWLAQWEQLDPPSRKILLKLYLDNAELITEDDLARLIEAARLYFAELNATQRQWVLDLVEEWRVGRGKFLEAIAFDTGDDEQDYETGTCTRIDCIYYGQRVWDGRLGRWSYERECVPQPGGACSWELLPYRETELMRVQWREVDAGNRNLHEHLRQAYEGALARQMQPGELNYQQALLAYLDADAEGKQRLRERYMTPVYRTEGYCIGKMTYARGSLRCMAAVPGDPYSGWQPGVVYE